MTQEPNPYESPQTIETALDQSEVTDASDDLRLSSPARVIAWTFLFGGNIVIPLGIGASACDLNAIVGLGCALVFLYTIGIIFIMKPRFSKALVQGGILVALSQFFPILHIFAGLAGMMIGTKIFPRPPAQNADGFEGYGKEIQGIYCGALTTLVTGAILMAIALGVGLLIREIVTRRRERRNFTRTYYK